MTRWLTEVKLRHTHRGANSVSQTKEITSSLRQTNAPIRINIGEMYRQKP